LERFQIERDWAWRGPLWLIGATESRAVAVLEESGVTIRFGFVHLEIPFGNIRELCPREWDWWLGIGIRVASDKTLGLIGSTRGVVQIALKEPSVRGVLFMRYPKNIAVSFADPTGFIAAVERRVSAS
jgi:hypothetical protein